MNPVFLFLLAVLMWSTLIWMNVSKIPIHMHCRIIADYIHMEQFFVDCNFLKWF